MSTLPRPTGKELVRALERVGFLAERTRGSHCFLRHSDGRATVIPLRNRTLGLGLLRNF
ncbi:MAG: type II toxin-antitoxin system HicA family toxin [Bryobacteraceae bacterium]|nr:type II toxin-antitoxin system HicA family toxin [Bryobacteraceae bacterium]